MHGPVLSPQLLLAAYAQGLFPMAERRDDPTLYWVSPELRGILPLSGFHVPHRLARTVRCGFFTVTSDMAFARVMEECAAPRAGREQSWINAEILRLYGALHAAGHAHSLECWQDGELVGGLYGVQLGAAFFGESMFSKARDASKVALVHLVEGLIRGGFVLLDTQFLTSHLARFGAVEIPRDEYLLELQRAIAQVAVWPSF
jgi:leucyl/phenylalanyl-tRNA--protein transferase